MAETAAHLVEHVLPEQPIRQWVLSFPYPLRFLFATRPAMRGFAEHAGEHQAASRAGAGGGAK